MMEEKISKNFIEKIKENKKYRTISDEIIVKEIKDFMRKYQTDLYDEKFAIKIIRRQLHRIYSSYQTKSKKKIEKLLDELKKDIENFKKFINPKFSKKNFAEISFGNCDYAKFSKNNFEIINEILSTTLSTKERLDKYSTIYNKIFELSKKPESIIDLGCGLNPVSIPYMNLKNLKYYAYDINNYDVELINKFFSIMEINGKADILDARDLEALNKIPKSDIIFMFKVYDLIVPKSKKLKKIGEEIINIIKEKAEFLVVSFATKTLTRKPMNLPRRIGFEMMLDRNKLKYNFIQTDNEIYYVVSGK